MPKELFPRRLMLHSSAKHWARPAPTGITTDSYYLLEIDTTNVSSFNTQKWVTKPHFLYFYVELL